MAGQTKRELEENSEDKCQSNHEENTIIKVAQPLLTRHNNQVHIILANTCP
jgi:hypothetical protein